MVTRALTAALADDPAAGRAALGLHLVDNTADANKPASNPVLALVADLATGLAGKAASGHNHAGVYAPVAHDHDDRYPTDAEVNTAIAAALANLINSAPGSLDQLNELAAAMGNDANFAATMTTALAGKQANSAQLTALAALTGAAYGRNLITLADQAALTALIAVATSSLSGAMSAQDKTRLDALHGVYHTLFQASGSHIAAKVAGTYGLGQGDAAAVTGTGTLYPLAVMYIDPADYPAVGSLAAKLRTRCVLECNDVAPTGNFTVALHPVTRPATSGGAGLDIYTIGNAVAGSGVTVATPAADSQTNMVGTDFAVPAAGFYVLALTTTATIATSAHVHASAQLQMHYA